MFRALLLEKTDGGIQADLRALTLSDLPDQGELVVEVMYSSLNYKDGLAVTGKGKIVRGSYPFVPGIDLAGIVRESDDPEYPVGTSVIVTGWGTGENQWGGYSQRARVRAAHCVKLPEGLSLKDAMAVGTAGFTAMLSVMALEAHGVAPEDGEIVVTGASGGVGSLSVALLAARGFRAVAATGTRSAHAYLQSLGARSIIPRTDLSEAPRLPLASTQWAGGIDAVGGDVLASVLAATQRHGAVAACGLAGGSHLHTTVFPFILRGVALLGIDSNTCPQSRRQHAWTRIASDLPKDVLEAMTEVIGLGEVPEWSERITRGETQGRIVVDVQDA